MNDVSLFRLAGIAAMAGGALRIAGTFAGVLGDEDAQLFYFITDVLLLAGLTGIYLGERASLGITGFVGFAIAVLGILMIRSLELFGGYMTGAAVTVAGFVVLGAAMFMGRTQKLAPALWIASLVFGAATGVLQNGVFAALAGMAFGAGFAWAGWRVYRNA